MLVRRIGSGRFSFHETVVAFEPNQRIDYAINPGGPLKNHLGQIRFTEQEGTTSVDYLIRFDTRFPFTGPLLVKLLRRGWASNARRNLANLESR